MTCFPYVELTAVHRSLSLYLALLCSPSIPRVLARQAPFSYSAGVYGAAVVSDGANVVFAGGLYSNTTGVNVMLIVSGNGSLISNTPKLGTARGLILAFLAQDEVGSIVSQV